MWVNRIICFLLWVLSLVGISYYGGPISYGFFWFMTLVPFFCLIYLIIVRIRFKVYQNMEGHDLVAHHPHPILFSLQNETSMTFAGVRVNLYSDFSSITDQGESVDYELLPRTGVRKEAELVCRYRGEYNVGVKNIQVQDYLRIFRFTYRFSSPLRVRVKPDMVVLDELNSVDVNVLTTVNTPVNPTEPDVLVRKYEVGDDIRYVNWKLSAATGELLIRKRIGEEQQGISILFGTHRDGKAKMEDYIPPENKELECALALALYFVNKNMAVHLEWVQRGVQSHTMNRPEQFDAIYEAVSACDFSPESTDLALFDAAYHSHTVYQSRIVFFVLQEWSEEILPLSETLNRHGIASVIYLISKDPEAGKLTTSLPRTEIHVIDPEADLREVM